jgi:1-aminocyclopropane-1-carboxylate deaminase/D-cysteine desulfhydrase-like pyridoxal-dependent ACC family enzyme
VPSSRRSVPELLTPYPSARLTLAPTPIHRMSRLSALLGHDLYVKRDDLSGFGIGGNKVRKLDYLLGDAIRAGADSLITRNASSFSRNAAVAGRALGLEVHVVVRGPETEQNPASQALFRAVGAELHYAASGDEVDAVYAVQVRRLRDAGRSLYELHPGGSDPIGSLSYLEAFEEIRRYSEESGVRFGAIVHATGSTATQVGLVLGQCVCGYDTEVIGMAISQEKGIQRGRVLELARRTALMLQVELDEAKVIVDDAYLGPGYPHPSPEGMRAVELFARTEGLLLDQVYGGKAAAGLIDYAERGRLRRGQAALFIHTGGNSDLYY